MAISTNGTVLARLAGGLYNQTLSSATYNEVVAVVKSAADINTLANDLYARDFASKKDLDVAKTLVANLGLSSITGLDNWVSAQLTAAGTAGKGAKIVSLLNDLSNLTSDATYGSYATAFNAKTEAALALSQTAASKGGDFNAAATLAAAEAAAKAAADAAAAAAKAAADAAAQAAADAAAAAAKAAADAAAAKVIADAEAAAKVPVSFSLTTNADVKTLGAGDDVADSLVNTADATKTTLTAGDSVAGGAGADKLLITVIGAAAPGTIGTGVRTSAIETIEATNLAGGTVTVDTQLMAGATTVSAVGGTAAYTFSNVAGLSTANVATSQDVTVTLAASVGTGTTDAASINLAGGATSRDQSVTYNGVENLTVNTKDTPTGSIALGFETTVASNTLKSLTLTGDQSAVLIANLVGATGTDTSTVNASAMTGALELTVTPGAALKASITAGKGADVITLVGTATDKYTIAGGDGSDVLSISNAIGYDSVLGASQGDSITAFETLRTTATVTQDMRGLSKSSITGLQVHSGAATLTNSPVISTLQIGAPNTGAGTGATITLATASNTTNDSIAITLGNETGTPVAANAGGAVALSVTNYEKVSINSVGAANGAVALTDVALTELTVTGNKSVAVTAGSTSVSVTKMDASTFTGDAITLSASGSTASITASAGTTLTAVITTGTGNDSITGSTGNDTITSGTGNDSVTAGAGNDTIDAGTGNDTVLGGDGNDTITAGDGDDSVDAGTGNDTVAGGLGNDTILGGTGNDTITGDSGNDNIDGGAGNDSLTAGTGTDTISGGAGNDTIVFGSSLSTGDNVDGGTDTDTLTATITASIAPTTTAVEVLDFSGTAGLTTQSVTSADPYGTAVSLTNVSGATTARVGFDSTGSGGLINAPATLTSVLTADNAATGNAIFRWASSPTAATITVDTMGSTAFTTAGADTLTIRQATTTAYNDTAGTGRVYSTSVNSNIGNLTTDARTLTIDMPTLASAQSTGGTNLTVGTVTAAANESLTISSGDYARIAAGAPTMASADFTNLRVTSGQAGVVAQTGAITASNANIVASAYIGAGVAGATTVGALTFAATTPITRMDLVAGIAGDVTIGAITAATIGTLNVNLDVNATLGGAAAGTTTIAPAVTTAATFTLGTGVNENFTITGATASTHGAYTLTGAGTATQTFTFSNGTTLSSFNASGFGGSLVLAASALTGNIGTVTGTGNADTLGGGSGNDILSGGNGADTITGGTGNDSLTGGEGADTINGGANNDAITLTETVASADVVQVSAVVGTSSDSNRNAVATTLGDDGGDDVITGFDVSNDTVLVTATAVANYVHVTDSVLGTGTGTAGTDTGAVDSFTTNTLILNLDKTAGVLGADVGDVVLTFNSVKNAGVAVTTPTVAQLTGRLEYNLTGTATADTITTGALNDTIDGGTGGDTINVGTGTDTVVITGASGSGTAVFADVLTAGTLAAGDTWTLTGADIYTGIASGDTINLPGTLTSAALDGTAGTAGATNYGFVRGTYAAGVFTYAAAGLDGLIVYHDGAAGLDAIVLIGVTALTGITVG
jgi:Ca2+-binding RTX toxin-like protein